MGFKDKVKKFIKNILGPKKPLEQLIKESQENMEDVEDAPIGRPFRVVKGGKDD